MNSKQTVVLWIGVVLVLACVAYPPYEEIFSLPKGGGSTEFLGYHPIASPPETDEVLTTVAIDTTRLFLQIGAIGLACGGLFYTFDSED